MPRPMRRRDLRAPSLSLRSLSFIEISSLLDTNEVRNLCDHAAARRRIRQLGDAPDLVQPKSDQSFALIMPAADRAADLPDLDGLGTRLSGAHHWLPRVRAFWSQSVAGASAS